LCKGLLKAAQERGTLDQLRILCKINAGNDIGLIKKRKNILQTKKLTPMFSHGIALVSVGTMLPQSSKPTTMQVIPVLIFPSGLKVKASPGIKLLFPIRRPMAKM